MPTGKPVPKTVPGHDRFRTGTRLLAASGYRRILPAKPVDVSLHAWKNGNPKKPS